MLFHLSRRKREEQPGTTLPCQISFYFFLQVVALQVSRLNMADFLEDEAMESEEEAVGSGYLLIDFFCFTPRLDAAAPFRPDPFNALARAGGLF